MKIFLNKWTGQTIPDESTLRKYYVHKNASEIMKTIKKSFIDKPYFIQIDEMQDINGRFIVALLIGNLNEDATTKPYVVDISELKTINNCTISQYIISTLTDFFVENFKYCNLKLIVSDAASYMVKAGKGLKLIFPDMIHITCLAHGLHRVCEKIRSSFNMVNDFF